MWICLLNPNLQELGSTFQKIEKSSVRIDGGTDKQMDGQIGWDDGLAGRTERQRKREKETTALCRVRPFYS